MKINEDLLEILIKIAIAIVGLGIFDILPAWWKGIAFAFVLVCTVNIQFYTNVHGDRQMRITAL